MTPAIDIRGLTRTFGKKKALDNVDLSVPAGDFFGLLGPNGAGKTTLIRILSTLIMPSSGSAAVSGFDVVKSCKDVRRQIGVVPQAMTTDLDLTAREVLDIYARFYGMGGRKRRDRIDELLELVGLTQRAGDLVATFSGGMRRRLEIARGLVHMPSLLILDEPTLGLDPQTRHVVWDILRRFRAGSGLTVLLTTHYMEEAESLCDHVAIIDNGGIVALDTVAGLKAMIPSKDVLELTLLGIAPGEAQAWITSLEMVHSCTARDDEFVVSVEDAVSVLPGLLEGLKERGATVTRMVLKEKSLEDVFIHFTGRSIREEGAKKVSFFIGAGVPRKMS
ncbi:MAG: ATP-binding cassette domain-containing protein [Thermodesulfobacteriota bacterium]